MPTNDDKLIKDLNQIKHDAEKTVINHLQEIKETVEDSDVLKRLEEIERNFWNGIMEIEELKKTIHPFKAQALAIADFNRKFRTRSKIPRCRINGMEL